MAKNIFIIIMYTFMAVLSQIDGEELIGLKLSDWFIPSYELDGKDICFRSHINPKVVVLVASAPTNLDQRKAIRDTWGFFGRKVDVPVGFVLGQSNSSIAQHVSQEAKLHDDLIIANFVDSYYNLTLKTLTMLDWAEKFCPMVKFLVKIDDDMFLNLKILLNITESNLNARKTIFGNIRFHDEPIRDRKDKHRVPVAEYPDPMFPPYVYGNVYLMTADCISVLKETAIHYEYMRLEDVFFTGIVASKTSINRVCKKEFRYPAYPGSTSNICGPLHSVAVQNVPPYAMYFYWRILTVIT